MTTVPRTFSLLRSQCVSIPSTVFSIQTLRGKRMFSAFVNIFLTKTCFSMYIAHSVNSYGLHFSATKNFMTDLFSSPEHGLIWKHTDSPVKSCDDSDQYKKSC